MKNNGIKAVILILFLSTGLFGAAAQEEGLPPSRQDSMSVADDFRVKKASAIYNDGVTLLEAGQYQKAVDFFTDALGINSSMADAMYNRGVALLALDNQVEAMLDFASAIQAEPKPEFLLGRGILLLYRKDTVAALSDFQKVYQANKSDPRAAVYMGITQVYLKSFSAATEAFSHVLATDSLNVDALNGRGTAYLLSGDTLKAVRDLEKSLAINPEQGNILRKLGQVRMLRKEYSLAGEIFRKAIRLDAKDAVSLNALAIAGFLLGSTDSAMVFCDKAIASNPLSAPAWNTRGNLHYKLQDFKEAELDYSKAISLDPGFWMAYYNRGVVREMLRDEEGACEDWQVAGGHGIPNALKYHTNICE